MFDDLIGRQLGEFRIEERIGQGAMAAVYRAYQPSVNRQVALKIIRLDRGMHEEFRRRFAREAEMIARLEHIHILPIYAYGIQDELAYLAMRLLRGGSLNDLMRRQPLSLDRVADIFNQVARGLAYAHSQGVIHRDLKPSNIMLDDAGNAYLTDFGLAKFTEDSAELTRSGIIVGTPAYMSPEQLRGEPLDHRSDLYSLGVILYNMVTGRLPFDTSSGDLVSIIYQHLEKPPTPPTQINPAIPPAVEAVILRALQKDRADRFDSAPAMARALNEALGRPTSSSDRLPLPRPPRIIEVSSTSRIIYGRPNFYLFAGAALLLVIAIIAFIIVQNVITNNQLAAAATVQAQTAIALEDAARQTAVAAAWTPTPPPMATVLPGASIHAADIEPTRDELALARLRLGPDGFIGYIACTLDSEYHAGLAREVRDLATQYGLNLQVYDSQADPYAQITQIERARTDGASALLVCPLDPSLLTDTLSSAEAQRLPMVFFAGAMPSYSGVLVNGDNYELGREPGRLAGQIIRDELGGRANVIILDFPDLPDIVRRAVGIEDGIREFAPEATIIGRFLGATRENGKATVAKLIADGVKFDVIVSINDAGAFGAIDALREAGFSPDSVIITSVDAEALAVQYIRQGYFMRGSVQAARSSTARALLNAMAKLLAGATIAERVITPPGEMVTRETLAEDKANR